MAISVRVVLKKLTLTELKMNRIVTKTFIYHGHLLKSNFYEQFFFFFYVKIINIQLNYVYNNILKKFHVQFVMLQNI